MAKPKSTFESINTMKVIGILDLEDLTIQGEDGKEINLEDKLKVFNGCDIQLTVSYTQKE